MTQNKMLPSGYRIKRLSEEDMAQMHRSFSEAFSDYPIPYNLSLDEFARKMHHKVHLDFDHSYGVFSGEKLVSFLFHSINLYEGIPMAYNAGTGVIPGHRGKGLSRALYEASLPALKTGGVKKAVLEVLEQNDKAINVYEQVGFEKTKQFACFQLKNPTGSQPYDFPVKPVGSPDLSAFRGFGNLSPSFGDTFEQIKYNISFECTLQAYAGDQVVGYLIFQPKPGRVTQFAVSGEYRRRGIGGSLLMRAREMTKNPLTVINVNREYLDVIAFLEATGFVNTLDQFEMQLAL